MAFRRDGVPHVFELAVGANQESASHDSKEGFAKKFLHAPGAKSFDRLQIRIAEQIEVEFLFCFEGGLRFDRVPAHAEDDHAQFVELLFCVAKLGRFSRSAGSAGFGIEKQDDAFAEEVGKRYVVAGVILQAKCRSFVADF